MKAHSWLGLAQYKNAGSINETVDKISELEGEIASIHYLIKQLKNEAIYTIALRQITDIKEELKNNEEINIIWNRIIQLIAFSDKFDLDKFSINNFQTASDSYLKSQVKDSVSSVNTTEQKLNKYEKIKNKKNNTDPTIFDSSKFYYYAINDLIKDESFMKKIKGIKDSIDNEEKKIEEYNLLSNKEKKNNKIEKINNTKINEFILVEPNALSYKNGAINYQSSEKLKEKYTEAINFAGKKLNLSIYNIDSENLSKIGTVGFNERSTLTNFLLQISHNEKVDLLPVDYLFLKEIEENYGTSKVIFTIVEHTYKPEFSINALYLILYPPALLGYFPIPFMKGNKTELNLLVLDTKKATIEKGYSYYFNDPLNKLTLKARMYDIFQNLNY